MAIKVNGTNVITDARALQNITSVDSTTKSAIETAGVGGLSTLITENGSTSSNSATVNFTFGDYRENVVIISGLKNTSSTANNALFFRMLDASGNAMTGDHLFGIHNRTEFGNNDASWDNKINVFGGRGISKSTQSGTTFVLRAYNAFDTGKTTQIEYFASNHAGFNSESSGAVVTANVSNSANSPLKNAGFQLYITSNQIASGLRFTKYGVV